MDLQRVLQSNFNFQTLAYTAARVVFIAVLFEIIAWWAGRRVEKATNPLITADASREANWRMRRRATLRQTPKLITRTLCYAAAMIAVLSIFETNLPLLAVPVMPVALIVAALLLIVGFAFLPILRDLMQGYAILAEDTLAVGDVASIDGHQGVVEKFTLRGVWLRDASGFLHCLSNRDISNVIVQQRRQEERSANDLPGSPALPPPGRPSLEKGKR